MKHLIPILLYGLQASLIMAQDTAATNDKITGAWNGAYKKMQFVFHIQKTGGQYTSTMDVVSQHLEGIKTTATVFLNDSLLIDGSTIGFTYKGKFDSSYNSITGVFTEGVNSIPLNLARGNVKAVETVTRPQEPVKPYPYEEEEVIVENVKDSIQLAGTLTLPRTNSKYPAVILITGSGPQNRDEEVYGHKPFLVLADYLTRQGIAVMRFDDRGINQSTGSFADATTADFSTDVLSVIRYLKSRKEIDSTQIGLIGHSEGGIIAPLVARQSKDVAFMILLAGTAVSGKETIAVQSKTLRGFPVPDEAAYDSFVNKALDIAAADKEVTIIQKELADYYKNSSILQNLLPPGVDKETFIQNLVAARTTPWIRYFYNYNPAKELEKVTCPVLSLNGSKDVQVPAAINQAAIRKALTKAGNKNFVVKELPGLNHFFQECTTGLPGEYARIEQTIAPVVLKEISGWLRQVVKD